MPLWRRGIAKPPTHHPANRCLLCPHAPLNHRPPHILTHATCFLKLLPSAALPAPAHLLQEVATLMDQKQELVEALDEAQQQIAVLTAQLAAAQEAGLPSVEVLAASTVADELEEARRDAAAARMRSAFLETAWNAAQKVGGRAGVGGWLGGAARQMAGVVTYRLTATASQPASQPATFFRLPATPAANSR